jgi:hypothetical protein
LGVGFGARVACRLGAMLERVGVGVALGVGVGVGIGVALGVATGALASSTGVVEPACVTIVNGSCCPVAATSFPLPSTYQPAPPATTLSTVRPPMIGPVIPRRRRRLSSVMDNGP